MFDWPIVRMIRWPVFWAAVQSLAAVIALVVSIVVAVASSRQLDHAQVDRIENSLNRQAEEVQRLRMIVEQLQGQPYRPFPGVTPGRRSHESTR